MGLKKSYRLFKKLIHVPMWVGPPYYRFYCQTEQGTYEYDNRIWWNLREVPILADVAVPLSWIPSSPLEFLLHTGKVFKVPTYPFKEER